MEIIQMPIIAEKIRLIVEEYTLGGNISDMIRNQLIDLKISSASAPSTKIHVRKQSPVAVASMPPSAPST